MAVMLTAPIVHELVIKKSRFIAYVEPVQNAQDAKDRIREIRDQYSDARHVCFAFYVAGNSGMSDDGEPSGTAGKPIFNVLNHKSLENILAVVVRYFGGIKLGAGGLSRAYGGAVSQALENAVYQPIEEWRQLNLAFPFALESSIRRVCLNFSVQLENVEYRDQVSAQLRVVDSILPEVQAALLAVAPGNSDLCVQPADEAIHRSNS